MRALVPALSLIAVGALAGCPAPASPDVVDAFVPVDVPDERPPPVDVPLDITGRDEGPPPDASDVRDVPPPLDTADAGDPCALATEYSYGLEGGMTIYTETSVLTPARQFTRRRVSPDSMLSCTTQMPPCGGAGLTIGDMVAAFASPDVVRAFRAPGVIVYGLDDRLADGQVMGIHRADGHAFLVGSPCAPTDPGCRPIPDGIATLTGLLYALDRQELARPECAMLR